MASATETIVSVPVRSSLRVKKKKSRKQKQSSGDQQSVADLRKLYDNLQKEHERVGSAFQNLKDQNEELARDLAEREADLEELTNLVSTKDEVIKNAERRLLHAKKLIADLKAEVQSLRSRNDQQEPEQQTPPIIMGRGKSLHALLFLNSVWVL